MFTHGHSTTAHAVGTIGAAQGHSPRLDPSECQAPETRPFGMWAQCPFSGQHQAVVWRMGRAGPLDPVRKATIVLLKVVRTVLPFMYYADPPAPISDNFKLAPK